ncbi:MAG: P-loop NTPase [Alphaproteobacteria bacterium]
MVQSALMQMFGDVEWGALDILVIDMPPGNGRCPLDAGAAGAAVGRRRLDASRVIGAVDARKAIAMFEKVRVPILGLVENMSYFACPHCGERSDIFGHGGARDEALRRGVPFLGEAPLRLVIRDLRTAGIVAAGDTPEAAPFRAIAREVSEHLDAAARPAPRLVIE